MKCLPSPKNAPSVINAGALATGAKTLPEEDSVAGARSTSPSTTYFVTTYICPVTGCTINVSASTGPTFPVTGCLTTATPHRGTFTTPRTEYLRRTSDGSRLGLRREG